MPGPSGPPPHGPADAWREKVDARVLTRAAEGPVDFIVFLSDQADLSAARSLRTKAEKGRFVAGALRARAAKSQAPLLALLQARGADFQSFWIADMIRVRGDSRLLEILARREEVLRIEGNPTVKMELPAPSPAGEGTEAMESIEWNLVQVGADQAWSLGFTGRGAVVAGQDTGYQWNHPALMGSYRGWDGSTAVHDYNWHDAIHSGGGICGHDAPAPCDDSGHGTHTMGTMVGDDGGTNRIGMAPGARWIGCRNMDQGNGTPATYSECFQWFVAPTDHNGLNPDPALAPDVISNSWVCPVSEGCSALTLETVVENTVAAGIVVAASAGNAGSACSTVSVPPAIYAASLTVGATDSTDTVASFSSRGPVLSDGSGRLKPDLCAPGVGVRSSYPTSSYATLSGTSMASPHAAGLVALLLEARPDLKGRVDEIRSLAELSSLPRTSGQDCGGVSGQTIPNNVYGYGRIDVPSLLNGDADSDGAGNLTDCRPVDPAVWSPPGETTDLTWSDASNLSWQPPAAPGCLAPSYDLLRSGRADDFTGAACLLTATGATQASDSEVPAQIFYYLVRSGDACGTALGAGSDGVPRAGPVCQ
jgi:serine protease AprX